MPDGVRHTGPSFHGIAVAGCRSEIGQEVVMSKRLAIMSAMIAIISLVDLSSATAQWSGRRARPHLGRDITPLMATLQMKYPSWGCSRPGPNPSNSCGYRCKPCSIYLCVAGNWRRVDLPKSPDCPGGSPTGPVCPVVPNPSPLAPPNATYCPSSCGMCVNLGQVGI